MVERFDHGVRTDGSHTWSRRANLYVRIQNSSILNLYQFCCLGLMGLCAWYGMTVIIILERQTHFTMYVYPELASLFSSIHLSFYC